MTRGRTTTYSYGDPDFPHQITGITDERGAVPIEYVYDDLGRVATKKIHGEDVSFLYGPPADVAPAPLPLLDPGNEITRVIDREGNVTDYELHGAAGGPIDELGKFGLRRKVMWTESGKGNDPLRDGEPMAWERRWLQDCDCLAPKAVSQPFRYEGAGVYADDRGNTIVLDDVDAMPVDYPTEFYDYNDRRQVTAYEYRGFDPGSGEVETIHWEKTYDVFERFSRELTYTEPRAFDDSGLYDGLDFTHVYTYDTDRDGGQGRFRGGNRIGHRAPLVTRGVDGPQVIEEKLDLQRVRSGDQPHRSQRQRHSIHLFRRSVDWRRHQYQGGARRLHGVDDPRCRRFGGRGDRAHDELSGQRARHDDPEDGSEGLRLRCRVQRP